MTPRQDIFYWRLWAAACRANEWRAVKGYVTIPPAKSDPAQFVITAAASIAEVQHHAVTMDDLRYAVHFVAIRHACSHAKIHPRQISRVFTLLKLLKDPDDLEAMNHWTHPDLEKEEREMAFIRSVPAAFVQGVCRRAFDGRAVADLDPHERRSLIIILSNARERWQTPMTMETA